MGPPLGPALALGPPLGPALGPGGALRGSGPAGPSPGPWWGPAGIGPWWGPAGIGPCRGPYKYAKTHIFNILRHSISQTGAFLGQKADFGGLETSKMRKLLLMDHSSVPTFNYMYKKAAKLKKGTPRASDYVKRPSRRPDPLRSHI